MNFPDSIIAFFLQNNTLWILSFLTSFVLFVLWKSKVGFKTNTNMALFILYALIIFFMTPFVIMAILHNVFWQSKAVSCVMINDEKCIHRVDCELGSFIGPGSNSKGCFPKGTL